MKVIQLRDSFGIDRLHLIEQSIPIPGPREVLVRLEAVSLNYVDLLVVRGQLNPNLPLPYVPICDGAGVVEQVGNEITAFKVGARVVTTFIPDWLNGKPTASATSYETRPGLGIVAGQLSEYKLFQANQLTHYPTHLSAAEASTLPIAGLTAWNALQYGGLQPGETVLLHGTGGVSIFALQFAKALSATVIITSSSDEKLKRAQQLGADALINYKTTPEWETVVHQATEGQGADVVVETVGGRNLQRSLNALRMGGHISIVGLLDGFEATLNTLTLLHQQVTIRGMEVGSTADFEAMNEAIATHHIYPVVDKTFMVEQTQQAFEYLEQGLHFGKIVITL
ncbi:NAD(P)-dependent alcohol dehydrogenase [Leptolyngbya sp. FACHB-671]|uniref:zinc-dependent alcohol dehydrogenase family protein n=1 Tax=Leptolyngbya sp. FACHB-671 TaxID=2692812 RepID=UPI001686FED5|nr:NAD(P)-dependent alcohol dehydrogenase [Leptolyngbya sp. FACHB-671]MBD2070145.1 NAD(P)-dependent alcohol dehydrogenase [Leptolyngbya sp. FACHB-671]